MTVISTVTLPSGSKVPALGQGTWYMGDDARRRTEEADALKLGIDLGMSLIDTAEMYASGGAEEVVAEAIRGQRDSVFVVSKVLPSNASRDGTIKACEQSLRRLQTDVIDLYLLHWRGGYALEETVAAFETLMESGKIRSWGVSNFDIDDMEDLDAVAGGAAVSVNQILYNLKRRGPEVALMPWCSSRSIPLMAYSPIEQGRLLNHPSLTGIAQELETTAAAVALGWVLSHDGVIAIPKSSNPEHIRSNRLAADLELTPAHLNALDRAFRRPTNRVPLEML
ncbi:diketogulonate reductase-like aldo/keto reductase [Phyllobacterium myrsinacearum]|uniref:Diketogulonate reductase-like aldo/keto reductase n=2 Tax=Phyllobacterium myrsinacearum TaxID=28101 RepID=A0A839ENS9_9HYPH|nr:diketogulonate reductase-like aldo/keto reductase [Phyllobacterium myrsinacearum]